MPGDPLYDSDFYTWTQRQAALVQESGDNRLDKEHLAEEVADLGRSELRACEGHLLQGLIHLIKLAANTSDQPQSHWHGEVEVHFFQAGRAFSPGMRQYIDLEWLWQKAVKIANKQLGDYSDPHMPRDLPCPFTLDDLLAPDFEPTEARGRIEQAIAAHSS